MSKYIIYSRELNQMDQYIRIALMGAVSAGKSTLLNAMLVARYSDMSIQRTTANEIIYYETNDSVKNEQLCDIHEKNQLANREIMNKTANGGELTIGEIKSIEYFVPSIYKLLERKLKPGIKLAIHDLPGLNDSKTSSVYQEYVTQHFYQYDIILFIVDVISGLNTCDEKNILKIIFEGIKMNKDKYDIETELIVILNKCDEMQIVDNNSYEARPINEEYKNMVEQVRTIVTTTAETMNIKNMIRFVYLSGEDAYIYRMYSRNPQCVIDTKHRNKFGINEYGKNQWNKMNDVDKNQAFKNRMTVDNIANATQLTGFNYFDFKLANILTDEKQFQYLLNHLKLKMTKIKMTDMTCGHTIEVELIQFSLIRYKMMEICEIYKKNVSDYTFFHEKFHEFLDEFFRINASYLIPLKLTNDDFDAYTKSNTLMQMFIIIDKTFMCWIDNVDNVSLKDCDDINNNTIEIFEEIEEKHISVVETNEAKPTSSTGKRGKKKGISDEQKVTAIVDANEAKPTSSTGKKGNKKGISDVHKATAVVEGKVHKATALFEEKMTKTFNKTDKSDNELFKNDNILEKKIILKNNIENYLSNVIACHDISYDTIIKTLELFIDDKKRIEMSNNLCSNLCYYNFIKVECETLLRDEKKMADRIINIIGNLQSDLSPIQLCKTIVQNVWIIINHWGSSMRSVYKTDPHGIIQIFAKYHINSVIKDNQGYDVTKELNSLLYWAHGNLTGLPHGTLMLPAILMDLCLNILSRAYPKHIVNLDVFYGVPDEYTNLSVDEFYAIKQK